LIDDTLKLNWYQLDWITGNYDGDDKMSFVLE